METTNIIIIILLVIICLLIIGSIFYYCFFKNKKNDQSVKKIKTETNDQQYQEYQQLIKSYQAKLNELSHLDQDALKKEALYLTKKNFNKELEKEISNLKKEANIKAANILVEAMQGIIEPIVQENSITVLKLDDELIKGKLIGKEGRNKKTFELISGVELIIDKDNPVITISSHHPIRREIAKLTLEKLLKSKNIDASKIENTFQEVKNQFEKDLYEIGKQVIEDKLDIHDLNKELYPYIGRMKYRSSFGQNTLNHLLECASIAKTIAFNLHLDEKKAIKCAFLHDLGKSMDYELNTNHVDVGIKIAKQLKLDDDIINAIASHHQNVPSNNIYSEITKIADTISASRPGARLNSSNEYFQRVNELENIINEFPEVNHTYVLKAGRYIRVIVNPIMIKDQEIATLATKIKDKIENNEMTQGYNIKVCLIKENKYEFETKSKLL